MICLQWSMWLAKYSTSWYVYDEVCDLPSIVLYDVYNEVCELPSTVLHDMSTMNRGDYWGQKSYHDSIAILKFILR